MDVWKSGGVADVGEVSRLAELTIALSLATDLGTGQPLEHGTCWWSLKVAKALDLDAGQRSCVYHVALLRFLGCTSDASETAMLAGGDDVSFNALFGPMLNAQPGEGLRFLVRHLGEELPLASRIGRLARALHIRPRRTSASTVRRRLDGHSHATPSPSPSRAGR